MAVLPPLFSPPPLSLDAFVSAAVLLLDGLAVPETPAEVALEAWFVGVRTEVMITTDGVSPARVAEGVTTMIEVWTSVAVGGADEAMMTEVAAGGAAEDCGAWLEAGGFDDAGGAADDSGMLTGGALDAGGAAEEGASEAWLDGEDGFEEGAAEGAAVALVLDMLTTIARLKGREMVKSQARTIDT